MTGPGPDQATAGAGSLARLFLWLGGDELMG